MTDIVKRPRETALKREPVTIMDIMDTSLDQGKQRFVGLIGLLNILGSVGTLIPP